MAIDILGYRIPYTSITIANLIYAAVVLVVGYIIIRMALKVLRRSLERLGLPPLVAGILTRLTAVFLYLALLLSAVRALGISTGAVTLSLGAAVGLILGFGLQDTMNNLAAGLWITVVRAFKKGDFVKVAGYMGTIEDVGVLSTKLRLPGGEVALIPNRNVWGSPIVNYSAADVRRFNFTVGVAYGTDLDRAVRVALEAVKSVPEVLDDPAPQIIIQELADSSINLEVRGWAKKEDLLTAKTKTIKAVYDAFNREGIEIPFPQLDVHLRGKEE
ncbi:MAG: mechanosensitive ion channel family protein [Desulfurococcales archaeon]|nr:mechanosensitive ion channel family protein [Desulfurococcales archaeon]